MIDPQTSTLQQLLRERRSVRHFTDEPVSRELVASIVEDASWAPSGGDEQPWAVTAVSPPRLASLLERFESRAWLALTPKIGRMIELASQRTASAEETLPRILEKIEAEGRVRGRPWGLFVHAPRPEPIATRLAEYREALARQVPAEVVPSLADLEAINGPIADGVVFASVVCFAYALTLSAHARGVATCMQHSWLLVREQLQRELEIPADRELQTVVLLGHPDATSEALRRARAGARRRPVAIDYR